MRIDRLAVLSLSFLPFLSLAALHAQRPQRIGASDPEPLRSDVQVRALLDVEENCVRIARDPSSGYLYYATLGGDIYRVDPAIPAKALAYTAQDHGVASPQGFAISPDGTFFLVGNIMENGVNSGIIRRGAIAGVSRVWSTVATAEPYPLNIHYNHAYNAVEVSPDGRYLYVNSGARTDHGEDEHRNDSLAGVREVPLTSKIFRLPADAHDIVLRNDLDSLREAGYIYAYGVRNSYDLAFAPDGELFAPENSDDRDDGEELNWIREGHHYGFPWRIGTHDTPQRFPGYQPVFDPLLNPISFANMRGFYYDDSTFPAPPAGVLFTDPIPSTGPDADRFRDSADGMVKDASELGIRIGTFTPHRSPLGLVFDTARVLSEELAGDGFMLSWNDSTDQGNLLRLFGDNGGDMLDIHLTKIEAEDRYEAQVTQIVRGFYHPVDAVMVDNRIYVIENTGGARIWEVTLPAKKNSVDGEGIRSQVSLRNHPNPFSRQTTIEYSLPGDAFVRLAVYDDLGREVRVLVNGREEAGDHSVRFDAAALPKGIYLYRLRAGEFSASGRMIVE
jgi:glucose/arabinose dehydrogenase